MAFVPPDDPAGKRLVIYGEAPGEEEARLARGFVGSSGKVLRRQLRRVGLSCWSGWANDPPQAEAVAFNNAVKCRPPANKWPGLAVAQECMERHESKVDVPVLACGANALEALTGERWPVLKVRGGVFPTSEGSWCVATIHPAATLRGKGDDAKSLVHLESLIGLDALRAANACAPAIPKVKFARGREVLAAFQASAPRRFAVDIEGTNGFPQIIGVSWLPGEAWVMDWSAETADCVSAMLLAAEPIAHNASFDMPELQSVGIPLPRQWVDTINLAALVNPELPLNLQAQVLTWVPGSVAWKGLVDHNVGYEASTPTTNQYERLWTTVLTRLGRKVPAARGQWWRFYNGLDTAWTLSLAQGLEYQLGKQGRLSYYDNLLKPIQRPLLIMGQRGVPVNEEVRAKHRDECDRLMAQAKGTVEAEGRRMLEDRMEVLLGAVASHEMWRVAEKESGEKKYSGAAELSKLRGKMRAAKTHLEKGFNLDSSGASGQRGALLYDWLGLPPVKDRKTKGASTNDAAIESLLSRLTRVDERGIPCPTIKPKRGTLEGAIAILRALTSWKEWAHLKRAYLKAPLIDGPALQRTPTNYALHRSKSGRLSSGIDKSDPDKGKRNKVAQLQNVPKEIRDVFVADPGHVLVGGDYAGIEWAIALWYCSQLPHSKGFHTELLDRFFAGNFDPHIYLASIAFGVPETDIGKDDIRRQTCKGYSHGRMFKGTPRGLGMSIGHPLKVAEKVCAAHEVAFRPAPWWEHEMALVKQLHYVETPLGWRKYFDEWSPKDNEVIGIKVQATAADLCKWIIPQLTKYEVLTSTHDSFLLQVPEKEKEAGCEYLRETMQQPVPWLGNRQWRSSVQAGMTWKDVS